MEGIWNKEIWRKVYINMLGVGEAVNKTLMMSQQIESGLFLIYRKI